MFTCSYHVCLNGWYKLRRIHGLLLEITGPSNVRYRSIFLWNGQLEAACRLQSLHADEELTLEFVALQSADTYMCYIRGPHTWPLAGSSIAVLPTPITSWSDSHFLKRYIFASAKSADLVCCSSPLFVNYCCCCPFPYNVTVPTQKSLCPQTGWISRDSPNGLVSDFFCTFFQKNWQKITKYDQIYYQNFIQETKYL